MSSPASPIIFEIDENTGFLNSMESAIKNGVSKSPILLNYPVVYIHEWKSPTNNPDDKYDIYVGESNDVIQRTKEHYQNASDPAKWQNHLISDGAVPKMYIVGHPHFNKSLTLDVENRLMDYVLGMSNIRIVHNGRGNAQRNYYPSDEFDAIFSMIWSALRHRNKQLFLSETEIKDSAIFKASPLHKLTDEQEEARKTILNRIQWALVDGNDRKLIFVEGDAGTGKTVLMSSIFYELLDERNDITELPLKCVLMVNHDEQITVYREIARKLHLIEKYGDGIVMKPTPFINSTDPNNPIDVAFVDEGHLLLTRGRQAYRGKNQLLDIMARAKVTIIMFDRNQILTAEEYWESDFMNEIRTTALQQGNIITLSKQLRMSCARTTLDWINGFKGGASINSLPPDDTGYEVKVFDTPEELHAAIKEKAAKDDSKLSRIVASYDWEYSSLHDKGNGEYWGVEIGSFFLPWNRELEKGLSKKEKRAIKSLAWAEQPQTINEAGSTFTIQGFDLSYAGVIIGRSVAYRNGKIIFDPTKSWNERAIGSRKMKDGTKRFFGEELLEHELHVLLTRGVKGLYIYAMDGELREALKKAVK